MVVRFLPSPDGESQPSGEDRANLAEVIELRSLLRQSDWRVPAEGPGTDGDGDSDAEHSPEMLPSINSTSSSRPLRDVTEVSAGAAVLRGVFPAAQMLQAAAAHSPAALPVVSATSVSETLTTTSVTEGVTGPERPANEDGVRLLSRKAKSSGELRQELLRLEHDPAEVDIVIAEFEQSLYLDDVGLARFLTEKLRDSKRASKSQIRVKLRERKLSDAAIETALAELDDGEELSLLRQAAADRARSMRDLDRQTAERRLLGFLARRGWSGEPATRAVRDALDGSGTRGGSSGVRFR